MAADKQYEDARQALRVIERLALPEGKFLTYGSLAQALGYVPSKYARHIGQVCSLIDAACYWSKLPMLSLEKVRLDDGSHNPDSTAGDYLPIKDHLIENSARRKWSPDDINRLIRTLDSHMNGESALLQWKKISSFGEPAIERLKNFQ